MKFKIGLKRVIAMTLILGMVLGDFGVFALNAPSQKEKQKKNWFSIFPLITTNFKEGEELTNGIVKEVYDFGNGIKVPSVIHLNKEIARQAFENRYKDNYSNEEGTFDDTITLHRTFEYKNLRKKKNKELTDQFKEFNIEIFKKKIYKFKNDKISEHKKEKRKEFTEFIVKYGEHLEFQKKNETSTYKEGINNYYEIFLNFKKETPFEIKEEAQAKLDIINQNNIYYFYSLDGNFLFIEKIGYIKINNDIFEFEMNDIIKEIMKKAKEAINKKEEDSDVDIFNHYTNIFLFFFDKEELINEYEKNISKIENQVQFTVFLSSGNIIRFYSLIEPDKNESFMKYLKYKNEINLNLQALFEDKVPIFLAKDENFNNSLEIKIYKNQGNYILKDEGKTFEIELGEDNQVKNNNEKNIINKKDFESHKFKFDFLEHEIEGYYGQDIWMPKNYQDEFKIGKHFPYYKKSLKNTYSLQAIKKNQNNKLGKLYIDSGMKYPTVGDGSYAFKENGLENPRYLGRVYGDGNKLLFALPFVNKNRHDNNKPPIYTNGVNKNLVLDMNPDIEKNKYVIAQVGDEGWTKHEAEELDGTYYQNMIKDGTAKVLLGNFRNILNINGNTETPFNFSIDGYQGGTGHYFTEDELLRHEFRIDEVEINEWDNSIIDTDKKNTIDNNLKKFIYDSSFSREEADKIILFFNIFKYHNSKTEKLMNKLTGGKKITFENFFLKSINHRDFIFQPSIQNFMEDFLRKFKISSIAGTHNFGNVEFFHSGGYYYPINLPMIFENLNDDIVIGKPDEGEKLGNDDRFKAGIFKFDKNNKNWIELRDDESVKTEETYLLKFFTGNFKVGENEKTTGFICPTVTFKNPNGDKNIKITEYFQENLIDIQNLKKKDKKPDDPIYPNSYKNLNIQSDTKREKIDKSQNSTLMEKAPDNITISIIDNNSNIAYYFFNKIKNKNNIDNYEQIVLNQLLFKIDNDDKLGNEIKIVCDTNSGSDFNPNNNQETLNFALKIQKDDFFGIDKKLREVEAKTSVHNKSNSKLEPFILEIKKKDQSSFVKYTPSMKVSPGDKIKFYSYYERDVTSKKDLIVKTNDLEFSTKFLVNTSNDKKTWISKERRQSKERFDLSPVEIAVKRAEFDFDGNLINEQKTKFDTNITDVQPGDVVRVLFETEIDSKNDIIQNRDNKWTSNIVNYLSAKQNEEIKGYSFGTNLKVSKDEIDIFKDNNDTWLLVPIDSSDSLRNIFIKKVYLYDENKSLVKEWDNNGENKGFATLKAGVNYYAEADIEYRDGEFKRDAELPITASFIANYGNIQTDMSSVKYQKSTASNADSKFTLPVKPKDSVKLKLNDNTNIKTYNETKDVFDPSVINLKAKKDVTNGFMWIKVNDDQPSNGIKAEYWDTFTINYTTNDKGKDNGIEKIELYGDGIKIAPDTCLKKDANYKVDIFVKRLQGDNPDMVDKNPELNLKIKKNNSNNFTEVTLYPAPDSPIKDLSKVGDTIKYTYVIGNTEDLKIFIEAYFPHKDANMANNKKEVTFGKGAVDLSVSNGTINDEDTVTYVGNVPSGGSITKNINLKWDANADIACLDLRHTTVTVEREYLRGGTSSYRNQGKIKEFSITFPEGQSTKKMGFTDNSVTFYEGDEYRYRIKINGGKDGYHEFPYETTFDNNEIVLYAKAGLKNADRPEACNRPLTRINWGAVEFVRYKTTGAKRVSATDSEGRPYTYCSGGRTTRYEASKSFSESHNIKVMFKSSNMARYDWDSDDFNFDDAGFVDINGKEIDVKASESFEVYYILSYETNRSNMPWTLSPSDCNPDDRDPDYYSHYKNIKLVAPSSIGSNDRKLFTNYEFSGSSDNQNYIYKVYGKAVTSPKNKDERIVLSGNSVAFQGYPYDDYNGNHPETAMCDNFYAVINIKGSTPIKSGGNEIE